MLKLNFFCPFEGKSKMAEPIRYLALDFDNCICHMNDAFWIVWRIFDGLLTHPELYNYYIPLREQWIKELDNELSQRKITFLNEGVLMLLKHIEHGPIKIRPKVFVYTNNTNEDIVQFVRDVIQVNMQFPNKPWDSAYHPQHPARQHELPDIAPDEPGKSFEGVRACLGNPEDLSPTNLLFLDDLRHPIQRVLEERYIHVQPPFKCKDSLLIYLETFAKAFTALKAPIPDDVAFRQYVRNELDKVSNNMKYFPSPRAAYHEWNLMHWNEYLALFQSFGTVEDEDENNGESPQIIDHMTTYYRCRDYLH